MPLPATVQQRQHTHLLHEQRMPRNADGWTASRCPSSPLVSLCIRVPSKIDADGDVCKPLLAVASLGGRRPLSSAAVGTVSSTTTTIRAKVPSIDEGRAMGWNGSNIQMGILSTLLQIMAFDGIEQTMARRVLHRTNVEEAQAIHEEDYYSTCRGIATGATTGIS